MKTYKIFVSPLGQTEAIKQGWSWPGCLFTTMWALVKKLWGIAAVLFGSGVLLSILMSVEFYFFLGVSLLGIPILVGSLGNQWREKNLVKRGYEYKETVEAQTPEAALALWTKEGKQ